MRVVFFGTPAFALPALRALARSHTIALVVTQPDRPAGRRKELRPPAVAAAARELGLPLAQTRNPNLARSVERIRQADPEVLVVAAYGRLIGAALLELCSAGVVNLHPSLLPAYRGAAPIQMAIADGCEETGVTLMRLDEGLDSGPIIAARTSSIGAHDTTPDLNERLAEAGAELLIETLPAWVAGAIQAIPQDPAQATLTRPLTRADGELDLRLTAASLYARWRAFQPWPGVNVWAGDTRCKLLQVRPVAAANGSPGQVDFEDDHLRLTCGQGALCIGAIQPEGRRSLSAAEFARGYRRLLEAPWGRPFPAMREPLVRRLTG